MVEAERSGYSRNLRGSHDDKLQTGAHVRMLHLISERHTPPTTAIQTGQSHRKGMRSTGSEAIVNYHRSPSPHSPDTPVIFCTLVLRCWCHRPSWAPASPPRVTFVTASLIAEQRGTVYISAKLALPFGLLPQSHYIFTFQAFS